MKVGIVAKGIAALALAGTVIGGGLLLLEQHREDPRERFERDMPVAGEAGGEAAELAQLEQDWHNRLTYPTGLFNPVWLRAAALQHRLMPRGVPAGIPFAKTAQSESPLALTGTAFTALGPQPLHMTGCSGCYDYTTTEGRVNAIVVDPTTTTNGSIVAYLGSDGGGVWKTTNCCSATTSWAVTTDDPLLATISIDTLAIDPSDHNTVYAGTGDLNYGSFSMGSQGILKTTDGGAHWTLLGADVFGPALLQPAGQFPQYDAVGKVRVDPRNGDNVVAGTKRGLFFSYDGGAHWTGPCTTNAFATQRQDITGLELSNVGGSTRIVAAVGVRGFATPVQYNLGENGANGLYQATLGTGGCPVFTAISTNANGWTGTNATSGSKYVSPGNGNQLGRIDIAVAPSDPNYIYAQVQSIAPNTNSGCGSAPGCQLGAWRSTDGGTTWTAIPGSDGDSLTDCEGGAGDYGQNWYDQGIAIDPTNPNRAFFDTFEIWFWDGSNALTQNLPWNDLTCGYGTTNNGVHVDQHALAFVPGGTTLLAGNDGGVHGTTGANSVNAALDPTWFNMDAGLNTIEFYFGDISGNFATAANPAIVAGAQDNGANSASFSGTPTGPVQWQMGKGGDGFVGLIDPVGTGSSPRFFQENNSGGFARCTSNCTASGATWSTVTGGWSGDTKSFIMPMHIFRGGIAGGDDCQAAGATTGCGHLLAGTTRVWETVTGAAGSVSWYVTNNPATQNLTKATLGNRSYINQVRYSPKFSSVAIVGTNDGNVQVGFNLGTGAANQATWVDVTSGNAVLPNRPVLGVALSPAPAARDLPSGYAAIGGFNANTPSTPGHLFMFTCTASNCAGVTWADKTGNLPDIPVDSVIANPNIPRQVFAGTDFGLYYTDDITAATPTWARFDNGLPHAMIWDLSIDRGSTTLAVFTRSRGAYAWPLPTTPPADLTPDPFTFADQNDVATSAVVTSETKAITGIDAPATVHVVNGEYSVAGGAFTAADGAISAGQSLQLRHTSAAAAGATTTTTVTVGTYTTTFRSTTASAGSDTTPDAFTFVARTGVTTNAFITSEAKTITGIDAPAAVGVSGGQYSIDNGAWTSSSGTIGSGQALRVRHLSSGAANTTVTTTVTVGTYSTPFSSTTGSVDRTPDAFDFGTVTGAEPNALVESADVALSGYNAALALQPGPGLEYSLDGGATWSGAAGSLAVGQAVRVRETSSATHLGYAKSYLKAGGVTGYFTVRTK